jgi:chaperonin GroEL (HSP60 family)
MAKQINFLVDTHVRQFCEESARRECDARHAAAVEEGIVPGGGVVLIRAVKATQQTQALRNGSGR